VRTASTVNIHLAQIACAVLGNIDILIHLLVYILVNLVEQESIWHMILTHTTNALVVTRVIFNHTQKALDVFNVHQDIFKTLMEVIVVNNVQLVLTQAPHKVFRVYLVTQANIQQ
jgi:hypothetical protein